VNGGETLVADLVIRNGILVLEDGSEASGLAIVIRGNRIAAICLQDDAPPSRQVVDAGGAAVVPGFIDPHVHTRAPGYEHKEDFESCSAAAVAGGITTFLAMFNVIPPNTTEQNCRSFIEYGEAHSLVNFNMYGLITPTNFDEIAGMARLGISSFKVLMGYKFETAQQDLSCPSDGPLLDAMQMVSQTGLPLSVHAENDDIIRHRQQRLRVEGRKDPAAHLLSRPNLAEEEAINRCIIFSRRVGNRLHFLHVSSKEGIERIREAKREGLPVTAETCPHYLLMTNGDHVARYGSVAKINPPIREQADQDALWQGINEGYVDVIGTDHAPQTDDEKLLQRTHEDIWSALPGFAGIETCIPLLLTEVNKGRLTLAKLVEVCSRNPARIFGLYPQRGSLRAGAEADIAILDPRREWLVDRRHLHSKATATPFEGWNVKGSVTHTIVNGTLVYENGEVLGRPGHGRFVRAAWGRQAM